MGADGVDGDVLSESVFTNVRMCVVKVMSSSATLVARRGGAVIAGPVSVITDGDVVSAQVSAQCGGSSMFAELVASADSFSVSTDDTDDALWVFRHGTVDTTVHGGVPHVSA